MHELQLEVCELTVSCHGPHIGPVHDTLVLLGQRLDVALAEVQDLLPEHSAVLVAGPLLDGEVQQHHAPDEPEADQEEAQLLGRQLPQERCSHADLSWKGAVSDLTEGRRQRTRGGIRRAGGAWLSQSVQLRWVFRGGCAARMPHRRDFLL